MTLDVCFQLPKHQSLHARLRIIQVGEAIQAAAGKTLTQRWFYPLGPINDLVPCSKEWSYDGKFI